MHHVYRKAIAIASSVLFILMLASPQPALGQQYQVDISSYDAFRAATMENAYICDDGDSAQCWDGACLLWQQLGRQLLTGTEGYASECWTNESSRTTNAGTEFTLITNFADVRRGDVVVMSAEPGNAAGHICYADQDYNNTDTLAIYGQNQRGSEGNHAFTVINKPNMDQLFLGAFRYKPWHDMQPPVISIWGDVAYAEGQIQLSFAVTDNQAVNPDSVKVYAYEFGKENERSEKNVVPEGNDVYSCTMNLQTSDKIWYFDILASDRNGNTTTPKTVGPISMFEVDTTSCSGVYKVIKDNAPIRIAPYEKINGKSTWNGNAKAERGAKVEVVGSLKNDYNNKWYQLKEGGWIYSENIRKRSPLQDALGQLISLWTSAAAYYINNQLLKVPNEIATIAHLAYNSAQDFNNTISRYTDGLILRMPTRLLTSAAAYYGAEAVVTHEVTFDGNGGYVLEMALEYIEDEIYGYLPEASRFGHVFAGWFTEPEGGVQILSTSMFDLQHMTLYAHWEDQVTESGSCGENLTWKLREDGLLKIEGTGDMSSAPWYTKGYNPTILDVELPDGLTSIANNAFKGSAYLNFFELPETLTAIGANAFNGCSEFAGNMDIPSGVTSIGDSAFKDCVSLTGVSIPEGVTGIGANAFFGCTGITEMMIPNSVQFLGNGCLPSSLTKLTIPFIGEKRTSNSSRESVLRYLFGQGSEYGTSQPFTTATNNSTSYYVDPTNLATLIVTDATQIPDYAFCNMPQLSQVTLNNGIASIGYYAFFGCRGIGEMLLPEALTSIGANAFNGCSNLAGYMDISSGVTSIGDSAFKNCVSLTGVSIPEGVTGIGANAFFGCTGISEMTIPNSVQFLGNGCLPSSLTKLTTPFVGANRTTNSAKESVLRYLFGEGSGYSTSQPFITATYSSTSYYNNPSDLATLIVTDANQIPNYAFYHMPQLSQVTLNNGITGIGDYAFVGCTGISGLTLPGGLTTLGSSTFAGCTGITGISLPETLAAIGANAFDGCSSIATVSYLSAAAREFALTIDSGNTLLNQASWQYEISSVYTLPEDLITVDEEAFYDTGAEQIILHAGIVSAGNRAFGGSQDLRALYVLGMETEIAPDVLQNSPFAVVYCYANSAAAQCCVANGIPCIVK